MAALSEGRAGNWAPGSPLKGTRGLFVGVVGLGGAMASRANRERLLCFSPTDYCVGSSTPAPPIAKAVLLGFFGNPKPSKGAVIRDTICDKNGAQSNSAAK